MNKKIRLICLIITCTYINCSFHPFFLSVTDLKYDQKESTFQISCKLFIDDFENALQKKYPKTDIDLFNPKNKVELDKIVNDYIQNNFKIQVNRLSLQYNYLGFEKEAEAIWVYFESRKVKKPTKVEIINSVLYDLLPEQTNIVHCSVLNDRKSKKVVNPENRLSFEF